MKKLLLSTFLCCLSFYAFAATDIKNMHNTALQAEINQVEQVNFDTALTQAQKIWSEKQAAVYHSTSPANATWKGKRVYDLISFALARENQRLAASAKQSDAIVAPLTQMLVLLQNTTNPDQDIREARLLFSQALMLEEIRLYEEAAKT